MEERFFLFVDIVGSTRIAEEQGRAPVAVVRRAGGLPEKEAHSAAEELVRGWVKSEEQLLAQRYERELMNPNEALSLGSISQIVMPSELRQVLGEHLEFCLRHYEPAPIAGVQRQFH